MVDNCRFKLTGKELRHCQSAYVKLQRLSSQETENRIKFCGLSLPAFHQYKRGNKFKISRRKSYVEIVIDGQVVRINLITNRLNLKVTKPNKASIKRNIKINHKFKRKFNGSCKSILKQAHEETSTPTKTVSFNNIYFISPISPRSSKSPLPMKDYESMYKEYLKNVQMNGSCSTPQTSNEAETDESEVAAKMAPNMASKMASTSSSSDIFDIEEVDVPLRGIEELPKRKRGRPKGSGIKKNNPDPAYSPSTPRKRGWPLGVPRRYTTITPKKITPVNVSGEQTALRKRGRPRKIRVFGFQTIASDIKTVSLPSDLWSAHVSVTAKKSQVCFTRVLQTVSNSVPVECDRSVKFNSSVKYNVRMNNREVQLLAAPNCVNSLKDVEILLEIVNELDINDPVLEYNR